MSSSNEQLLECQHISRREQYSTPIQRHPLSITRFIGIDWCQSHCDVVVLASDGVLLTQFRISKTPSGFSQLAEKIDKFGLPSNNCHLGLETAHNVLIDFLWSRQYSVYVFAPSIVNSSRGRFGGRDADTDERDVHLIADLLRNDRVRFSLKRPDSKLVTTMKAKLGQVTNMTKLITGQTNRLRAVLWRVYPQAIQTFGDLTNFIAFYFYLFAAETFGNVWSVSGLLPCTAGYPGAGRYLSRD